MRLEGDNHRQNGPHNQPRDRRGIKHQHWNTRRCVDICALQLLRVAGSGRDRRIFQWNFGSVHSACAVKVLSVHGVVAGAGEAGAGGDC